MYIYANAFNNTCDNNIRQNILASETSFTPWTTSLLYAWLGSKDIRTDSACGVRIILLIEYFLILGIFIINHSVCAIRNP